MEWCVCKNKETSDLFVQSRQVRETMIAALNGIDQINSVVLKTFDKEKDAQDYIDDINLSNEILNKIL